MSTTRKISALDYYNPDDSFLREPKHTSDSTYGDEGASSYLTSKYDDSDEEQYSPKDNYTDVDAKPYKPVLKESVRKSVPSERPKYSSDHRYEPDSVKSNNRYGEKGRNETPLKLPTKSKPKYDSDSDVEEGRTRKDSYSDESDREDREGKNRYSHVSSSRKYSSHDSDSEDDDKYKRRSYDSDEDSPRSNDKNSSSRISQPGDEKPKYSTKPSKISTKIDRTKIEPSKSTNISKILNSLNINRNASAPSDKSSKRRENSRENDEHSKPRGSRGRPVSSSYERDEREEKSVKRMCDEIPRSNRDHSERSHDRDRDRLERNLNDRPRNSRDREDEIHQAERAERPRGSRTRGETKTIPVKNIVSTTAFATLPKTSISRLSKVAEIASLSADVYDPVREKTGAFLYQIIDQAAEQRMGTINLENAESLIETGFNDIHMELVELQKLEIAKATFEKYLKALVKEQGLQIKKEAINPFHIAAESYIINLFREAQLIAHDARRSRITVNDLELAIR